MFVACTAAMFAFGEEGTERHWTGAAGNNDWTDSGNYDAAGVPDPEAQDTLVFPTGARVTLDGNDAGSCNIAQHLYRMMVAEDANDVVITVDVPENGIVDIDGAITPTTNAYSGTSWDRLHVVKKGLGLLQLNSDRKFHVSSTSNPDRYGVDYYSKFVVEEGTLRFPTNLAGTSKHAMYVGYVAVSNGATVFTGIGRSSVFNNLYGSGLVTNDARSAYALRIDADGDFSGELNGSLSYDSRGKVMLRGTNSTMTGSSFAIEYNQNNGLKGVTGVAKIGRSFEPSSIGLISNIYSYANGGRLLYLGTGERTDKAYLVKSSPAYMHIIDGGATGGLVWEGPWGQDSDGIGMVRLVLQGSNTVPCEMNGPIRSYGKGGGTNLTFCITKQGTGTWNIKHNDSSRMHGVWRIVDGTLKYDTIAERNVNSALGSSTMLYKDTSGDQVLDANKVDYAFWLGGGTSGKRANLEYVGETNCVSTTRRFAVNGTGAVLNNGGGFLRLSDFFATNTASTLILGGTNTLENVADCIADGGNANMSVVKEGSGTWRLGTNCTFTGSLAVNEGKVIIGNPEQYSYYRWVIRATFSTETSNSRYRVVGLKSFGLFDADGNDRLYALSNEGDWHPYSSTKDYYTSSTYTPVSPFCRDIDIAEGHFLLTRYDGTVMSFTVGSDLATVSNLFAHVNYQPNFYSRDSSSPPIYGDETKWVTFTMRPKPGAPITSWDYVNSWYQSNYDYQMISNCVLEASVDGNTWDRLDEVTNDTKPTRNTWQSDNTTAYEVGYTTHTTGMPIPPGPTNDVTFAASSVSVAAGAELVAHAPEKPVIRTLTVDGLAGGGTIDGFALASDLTLAIDNVASASGLTIPMTFRNVEGLDASGWTVSVGGSVKASLRVRAASDGLTITPPGTRIFFR